MQGVQEGTARKVLHQSESLRSETSVYLLERRREFLRLAAAEERSETAGDGACRPGARVGDDDLASGDATELRNGSLPDGLRREMMKQAKADDGVELGVGVCQLFDVLPLNRAIERIHGQALARNLQHGFGVIGTTHVIALHGQMNAHPAGATGQVQNPPVFGPWAKT